MKVGKKIIIQPVSSLTSVRYFPIFKKSSLIITMPNTKIRKSGSRTKRANQEKPDPIPIFPWLKINISSSSSFRERASHLFGIGVSFSINSTISKRFPISGNEAAPISTILFVSFDVIWISICFNWSPGQLPTGIFNVGFWGKVRSLNDYDVSAGFLKGNGWISSTLLAFVEIKKKGYWGRHLRILPFFVEHIVKYDLEMRFQGLLVLLNIKNKCSFKGNGD